MGKRITYLFLMLSLFMASCSDEETSIEENNIESSKSVPDEILELVNEHRQSIGLTRLSKNTTAENLAIEHTNYMISQRQIGHDNFDQHFEDIQNLENAVTAAENVAAGYPTARAVVEGWLNSSGHRTNIEGNFTHIGIAAIQDSQGRYYFTQFFYR